MMELLDKCRIVKIPIMFNAAFSNGIGSLRYIIGEDEHATIFEGNSETREIASNILEDYIHARVIVVYPLAWYNQISLRLDLIGCGKLIVVTLQNHKF